MGGAALPQHASRWRSVTARCYPTRTTPIRVGGRQPRHEFHGCTERHTTGRCSSSHFNPTTLCKKTLACTPRVAAADRPRTGMDTSIHLCLAGTVNANDDMWMICGERSVVGIPRCVRVSNCMTPRPARWYMHKHVYDTCTNTHTTLLTMLGLTLLATHLIVIFNSPRLSPIKAVRLLSALIKICTAHLTA